MSANAGLADSNEMTALSSLFLALFFSCLVGPLAWADESNCFAAVCQSAGKTRVVSGENGWSYPIEELRFLTKGVFWGEAALDTGAARNPAHRDPLEPIDDFNRQLADLDVQLLIVPIPPKALIYPLPLGCTREDTRGALGRLRTFYAELRQRGVQVLDLTEDFLALAALAEGRLYEQEEPRLSGIGTKRAAAQISDWLVKHGAGSLSESPPPLGTSRERSVLLLGDRTVERREQGAGLPEQLAFLLGQPIDAEKAAGFAATSSRIELIRLMNASPGYIKGKRFLIWCFTATDFTEADAWRFVPLPVN